MSPSNLEHAIENEFVSYYQVDELPTVWKDDRAAMDWSERAPSSARRLLHAVGKERAGELIEVLERMRNDPQDLLVLRISGRTRMLWYEDPQDWQDFQELLDRIVTSVRATTAVAGPAGTGEK